MALCSMGIAAAALGVFVAVKGLLFRARFRRGPWALAACGPAAYACGAGCGGHDRAEGHGGRGWGRFRRGWGPGRSFWLRSLFARLDTTPGQEREIRSAIEEFQQTAQDAKDGLKSAREVLSRVMGAESFDDVAIGEAEARVDATASQMKAAFVLALKRIHGVLDPKQRERLAEILAKGPGFGPRGWGHPYRESAS